MISGIFTLLAFACFLGITAWAYARHNRERFEEASMLPLTEDAPAGACGSGASTCCCQQEKPS